MTRAKKGIHGKQVSSVDPSSLYLSDWPVIVLVLVSFIFWAIVLWLRYWTFGFLDWDLSLFSQILWNLSHGNTYSSVLQVHFLGNHANFFAFLVVPLYAFLPHPYTLLLLKAAFCSASAFVFYLIARNILGRFCAACLSVAFLFYPPLTHAVAFEFDFEALSPLFIMGMWLAFIRGRKGLFLLFALLCILLKENMPLVVGMFCLMGFFTKKEKLWWFVLGIVCVLCFLAVVLWMAPALRGTESSVYWTLYSNFGDSPGSVIKNLIFNPRQTFSILFSQINLSWYRDLFAPMAFLSVAGIDKVFFVLPSLLQHALSKMETSHTIFFHYSATISPFIAISALYGIKRVSYLFRRFVLMPQFLSLSVLVCSIASQFYLGPWVAGPPPLRLTNHMQRDDLDWARAKVLSRIPKDASVVATFQFMPFLSRREHLYGFYNAYNNRKRIGEPQAYSLPDGVGYAILDMNDPQMMGLLARNPGIAQNIAAFYHRYPWQVEEVVESILLLKAGSGQSLPLYDLNGHEVDVSLEDMWQFQGGLNLQKPSSAKLGEGYPGSTIPISLVWKSTNELSSSYVINIKWINEAGSIVSESQHPLGYRVFPAWMWQKGALVREHLYLLIGRSLKEGRYGLVAQLMNEQTRQPIPVLGKDEWAAQVPWVSLGEVIVKNAAGEK